MSAEGGKVQEKGQRRDTDFRLSFHAVTESARRPASSRPIQQLTGQVSSQDSQYQCGQSLLQLGMVAAMPITSPMIKNQSTCRAARRKTGAEPGTQDRDNNEERRARHERGAGGTALDEISREQAQEQRVRC